MFVAKYHAVVRAEVLYISQWVQFLKHKILFIIYVLNFFPLPFHELLHL